MTEVTKDVLSGAAIVAILLGIVGYASKHWIEGVEVKAQSTEARLQDATLRVARFEERMNMLERTLDSRFDRLEQIIERKAGR